MTNKANLPPMPDWIVETQCSYAQMTDKVFTICERHDLTPQQAILMACIGDEQVNAGSLRRHGYYIGSNVSYNLNKLQAAGHLVRVRPKTDRRNCLVSLTPKGLKIAVELRMKLALQKEREAA